MKHLKVYNESGYSVAAKLLAKYDDNGKLVKFGDFTPNSSNVMIKSVSITFPDGALISYDILSDNFYDDVKPIKLKKRNIPNNHNFADLYLEIYGNCIQFENHETYMFVRGLLNPADVDECKYNGYIFDENDERGFHEVEIGLSTESDNFFQYRLIDISLLYHLKNNLIKFKKLNTDFTLRNRLMIKLKNKLLDVDSIDDVMMIDEYHLFTILYSCVCKRDKFRLIAMFMLINMNLLPKHRDTKDLDAKYDGTLASIGEMFYDIGM